MARPTRAHWGMFWTYWEPAALGSVGIQDLDPDV